MSIETKTFLKVYADEWSISVNQNGEFIGESEKYDNHFTAWTLADLTKKIADYVNNLKKSNIGLKRLKVYHIESDNLVEAEITSIAEYDNIHKMEVWYVSEEQKSKKWKAHITDYPFGHANFALRTPNNEALKTRLNEITATLENLRLQRKELLTEITDKLDDESYLKLIKAPPT